MLQMLVPPAAHQHPRSHDGTSGLGRPDSICYCVALPLTLVEDLDNPVWTWTLADPLATPLCLGSVGKLPPFPPPPYPFSPTSEPCLCTAYVHPNHLILHLHCNTPPLFFGCLASPIVLLPICCCLVDKPKSLPKTMYALKISSSAATL